MKGNFASEQFTVEKDRNNEAQKRFPVRRLNLSKKIDDNQESNSYLNGLERSKLLQKQKLEDD